MAQTQFTDADSGLLQSRQAFDEAKQNSRWATPVKTVTKGGEGRGGCPIPSVPFSAASDLRYRC